MSSHSWHRLSLTTWGSGEGSHHHRATGEIEEWRLSDLAVVTQLIRAWYPSFHSGSLSTTPGPCLSLLSATSMAKGEWPPLRFLSFWFASSSGPTANEGSCHRAVPAHMPGWGSYACLYHPVCYMVTPSLIPLAVPRLLLFSPNSLD